MSQRRRTPLQRFSQQLTFGKLSLGTGRRSRRSRRLRLYEQGEESASVVGWLREVWARLLILGLLAMLLYIAFGTSWFYIYDVEVQGAQRLSKEELYHLSNLEALSVFWLNPQAVARRLEAEPLVARAHVALRPPSHVTIHVEERLPLAVWQTGNQSLFVDEQGVLFGLRGDASEYLVIRDLRDVPVEGGQQVDEVVVRTAWELAQLIPERRAFDWEPGVGLSFVTEGGWRVTFGDYTRLSAKVAAFHAFQSQIQSDKELLLLDLSDPDHPYYRVVP